jgi:FlaA1/EpsC-like NDP-sugar epimerase
VKLQPAGLWLIDRNENDLYFLRGELDRQDGAVPHFEIIRDIRDEERMARILREIRPTHVFHAAAFKHVPLMEAHPVSAVENNILGTWSVLRAAMAAGARKFVLISTDKAVEPSSVMGATKRFAEMLVAEGTRSGPMAGVIVRFGNVLGSNGSVVPLFQRQIAAGGPVTLTSRETTRYFMTTAEAAQLVLQATSLPDTTGKIAILDMGTPVLIADLAERLIALSGFRPGVDIEIVETGMRPGEKLHERLWWESERVEPSSHPKISLACAPELAGGAARLIPEIVEMIEAEDRPAIRALLDRTTGLRSPEEAAAKP